ncbi:MAG: peptide chain release factor N(5)-glutamine methyltransferase [Rhodospirillales bacterium]|nr:peptide chain release factor N(5)-glutamine methyltransferase [Rhodospirillales bacterium]MBO6788032.1 peptide chain release factor N(5)-glutamine methyltransferase [Rhodospirillales bacterium]
MTSVGTAITEGMAALADAGVENPRKEARLLLGHVLKMTPAQVFARAGDDVSSDAMQVYYAQLSDRCRGMPLAHITGRREFWSLDFLVSPATLIPRPDTETVIELAEELFRKRRAPARILDLGTGSGCILLALLTVFEQATGTGMDVSAEACRIAEANALSLDLAGRAEIVMASWSDGIDGKFDLIASNPPYIPHDDIAALDVGVRDHEPASALDGGADGLDAYRSLIPVAIPALTEDGLLILEIGIGQSAAVSEIASAHGLVPGPVRRDLAGIERAVSFYKKGVGIT